ncbi:hypothetical protein [Streptomyces sp. NPDC048825]|uniref:hypothetical protein n=1 Tax=Streptomyces sp. NPDC048825 TaxID=3365592 RepID=UPI0037119911
MKRAVTATTAAAVLLAIAGCSSDTEEKKESGAANKGGATTQASAEEFARTYQEAVNDENWQRVCQMRTERYRYGTVQSCVDDNTETTPTAAPSLSETSDPPLRRADGSVIPTRAAPSASGPERAATGRFEAGDVVTVPAIGDHPAGTGVGVEYTVTWPDSTTTTKEALRMVKQGGEWFVDQAEEIHASDEAHGNPVRDALMNG